MPPAAGGASPPGSPDRQGAGAGYGFEFFAAQKSQNRGDLQWVARGLSAVYATGCYPVGVKGRSALVVEDTCARSALLPVPDCKSGRVAHKVCKPQGCRPACRESGRLPPKGNSPPAAGGASRYYLSVYRLCRQYSAPACCRSGSRGEAPLSSKTLVREAPCYRCLIVNQAA